MLNGNVFLLLMKPENVVEVQGQFWNEFKTVLMTFDL